MLVLPAISSFPVGLLHPTVSKGCDLKAAPEQELMRLLKAEKKYSERNKNTLQHMSVKDLFPS